MANVLTFEFTKVSQGPLHHDHSILVLFLCSITYFYICALDLFYVVCSCCDGFLLQGYPDRGRGRAGGPTYSILAGWFSCEVPGLQTCDWYEQMEAAKGVGSSAKTHASVHLESVHPDGEKVVVRSRPDRGLLVALEHGRVMMCNIKVSWVDSHDTAVQLMIELATHYLSGAAAKTKLIQNQFSTFKFVT